MIVNSAFKKYSLLALFIFLRVMTCTTENHDSSTDMNTSNDFENTTGEYNITTDAPNDYPDFSSDMLKIIEVRPTKVVVDSTTELELSIADYGPTNTTSVFCFLTTPDNDIEILSSYWISNTQLNCTGFSPIASGLFAITLDLPNVGVNFSDKMVTVKAISKHPVAERAEYSYSFDKIFIHFDANIELDSNCASAFSRNALENFGAGFKCAVMGNVLVVKMGIDFKPTTQLEIRPGNKICRSGSKKKSCFTVKPGKLEVKAPRVPGPTVSLLTTSECKGNASEKYVSLEVSSNGGEPKPDVSLPDHFGKNQRKNLILWRTLRRIQNKFSSNLTLKIDKPSMGDLYENLASVENFLENETVQPGSSHSGVTVSVHVQSSLTGGTISAEANVTFCKNFSRLFRYKWFVNERILPDNDRLIKVQDVIPGKYIIKCNIMTYNSSEVLGQGSTTTEVFDSRPKVIIYPVEIVTGMSENVSLHAVVWQGGKISWACRTKFQKVCITNSQQLISDVLDMNSSNISIPAGILPAGEYMWTVENAQGVTTAKIIVKPENVVTMNIKLGSIFVERSQKITLQGVVKRLQNGCRLWWSSVRQKGFNYVNLQMVGGDTEVLVRDGEKKEQKIDLVFPPTPDSWKHLEPDSLYMFKLQVFCPRPMAFEYVKIPISVNNPPRVSPIRVEPGKGLAMATNFIVSKVQANDSAEDYPLMFEWSYLDTCGVEVPITRGVYSRQVATFLPPGDIKMILRVCDVKRACAKVSSPVIDVTHSKIVPENFHNAANQIYHLILGPDYLEGFGLATTVFKSLALKAETEVRRVVYRSVEDGIRARIKQFREITEATSKGVRSWLDFVDRALNVARYFPKSSGLYKYLKDFQNNALEQQHAT